MNRRAAVLFVALGIAWGIPYLLIKVAVDELAPEALVLFRTALAALLLLPVAVAQGAVRPVLRRWKPLLAFAATEIAVPFGDLIFEDEVVAESIPRQPLEFAMVRVGIIRPVGEHDVGVHPRCQSLYPGL